MQHISSYPTGLRAAGYRPCNSLKQLIWRAKANLMNTDFRIVINTSLFFFLGGGIPSTSFKDGFYPIPFAVYDGTLGGVFWCQVLGPFWSFSTASRWVLPMCWSKNWAIGCQLSNDQTCWCNFTLLLRFKICKMISSKSILADFGEKLVLNSGRFFSSQNWGYKLAKFLRRKWLEWRDARKQTLCGKEPQLECCVDTVMKWYDNQAEAKISRGKGEKTK